jgi:exopolyphosphatase/guanosine-5'-triphosphate,3'-diphosphate pyrophosphatase
VRLADLRRESLLKMVEEFEEDQPHVLHGTDLALQLFDALLPIHQLSVNDAELLEAGGLLANIGLLVSHAAHHQHSEYIIRNTDRLAGYTEREIEIIAQVARYHRRSAPKKSHPNYQKLKRVDRNRVSWLAGMLRVAIALDRTRQAAITAVSVTVDDDRLVVECQVANGVDASVEEYTAMSRTGLLESVSDRRVIIRLVEGS